MTDLWLASHVLPAYAVAVPLALAVLIAAGGRPLGRAVAWLAMVGPVSVLGCALVGVQTSLGSFSAAPRAASAPLLWLPGIPLATSADGLAVVMLLVVGVVALCVMLFSVGYMQGDPGYARYYAVLSLFTAAMALLAIADNLVLVLVAWELVGVCSYLLIGFWFRKASAANAAIKAFLVTHVGDAGMLLGIAVLWNATGSLSLSRLGAAVRGMSPALVTATALLLLLGAVGKSAQFPLHFWLPDAMEGPTPVSALIHAATMVAAGVFLIERLRPLFEASPAAMAVVLAIGAFTALLAATVAVVQTDIKKVLAYSTISQLGFMFAALGAGAWTAAMFHLVTHAAFKALLFLAAGSVIHGADTQELVEMGGLARKMPLTAVTWCAGALALAGIPPMAGFFSKDAVVAQVLHASPLAGVALLAASLLTAFYITRATRLAFFGEPRREGEVHESGWVMAVPLVVLAVGAAGLGLAAEPVRMLLGGSPESFALPVAATAVVLALAGATFAWVRYGRDPHADDSLATAYSGVWGTVRSGYGYDAAVSTVVVRPALALAQAAYRTIDRANIDGWVEGVGRGARGLGRFFASFENGDGQWYAVLIAAGVILLLAWPGLSVVASAIAGWFGR